MFSSRNKKNINIFWLRKKPYLKLWICEANEDSDQLGHTAQSDKDLLLSSRNSTVSYVYVSIKKGPIPGNTCILINIFLFSP